MNKKKKKEIERLIIMEITQEIQEALDYLVLIGNVKMRIVNGEAVYKLTEKGIKEAENDDMFDYINNNLNK